MRQINYFFRKSISMPPHIFAYKIYIKIKDKIQKSKDLNGDTNIKHNVKIVTNSYIDIEKLDVSNIDKSVANYLSKMYCEHRFDLLGSGWVKNSYNSIALGVEDYSYEMNISTPKRISEDYEPIDWQKDYKSGFRWSENTWYKDISYGEYLGVDIKVPWELARFQHLPQLAIFSIKNSELTQQNITEFKNQVLDFIEYNPPRIGVNWSCTMDVGIRIANILVTYDLFSQLDDKKILTNEFNQIFSNSVYEHGLHIINNLEFNGAQSNNHYMSNIAGLLFVASYLDSTDEVDNWLAFSIQELVWCMKTQFYEDGGNFESSTNYHRLSGEIMTFSTALILGLKEDKVKALKTHNHKSWTTSQKLRPLEKQEYTITKDHLINLPQWYIDRSYRAGKLSVDLTKPSGEVAQIGDNDNGRFFRFSPNGKFITDKDVEEKYLNLNGYNKIDENNSKENGLFWDENILDHRTFISLCNGLFDDKVFTTIFLLEKSIIKSIAKRNLSIKNNTYKTPTITSTGKVDLNFLKKRTYQFSDTSESLKRMSYPHSGIYIFKADNLHLTVCSTPLGQNGNGGHAHNDKLSYELWLNGKDVAKDPGTYVYTPLPKKRNIFRSILAHNVPIVDNIEQNSWVKSRIGLFKLSNESKCFVIDYRNNIIELFLEYNTIKIIRKIEMKDGILTICDRCNKEFGYSHFGLYSNGYGKIENSINE